MITLAAPSPVLDQMRAGLWHAGLESAAILLCTPVQLQHREGWRLIVREVHVAPSEAYEERTHQSARLAPAFGLPLEKRARENRWSLVYCHTHPHQIDRVAFSTVDDASERPLAVYASTRSPDVPHAALVLGEGSVAARRLGSHEGIRIVEVGSTVRVLSDPDEQSSADEAFDRQVRVFGAEGQRRLGRLQVAIVGLGGTGSVVAQQLAHLGVTDFVLVDRDRVERTNLNRTVGAEPSDVGAAKVAVAERLIRQICPTASVTALEADVVDQGVGRRVAEADAIFCCTDSQASRHLLNQVAYQYLVPVIDLGVAIDVRSETKFAGHVKALLPGLPCLWCIGNLDSSEVRRELMNAEHRNADPYFTTGRAEPQPAVISINSTVASLAVTMFLSMMTGVPAAPRYLIYDGNRARVSAVAAEADPACNFCSPDSTALGGDAFPIPERRRGEG